MHYAHLKQKKTLSGKYIHNIRHETGLIKFAKIHVPLINNFIALDEKKTYELK